MKDLRRHIVAYAAKWKDLGLQLGLDIDLLNVIYADYPHSVEICCRVMLSKWLERDLSATWGKLDDTIRKLTSIASPMFQSEIG